MLDEDSHQVVDLPKGGVRKYAHSASAFQDEIYFFRRLINPMKVFHTYLIFLFCYVSCHNYCSSRRQHYINT